MSRHHAGSNPRPTSHYFSQVLSSSPPSSPSLRLRSTTSHSPAPTRQPSRSASTPRQPRHPTLTPPSHQEPLQAVSLFSTSPSPHNLDLDSLFGSPANPVSDEWDYIEDLFDPEPSDLSEEDTTFLSNAATLPRTHRDPTSPNMPHAVESSSMAARSSSSHPRKRSYIELDSSPSASSFRHAKRTKPSSSSSKPSATLSKAHHQQPPRTVEEISLLDDENDALNNALKRQLQDQVNAQRDPSTQPTTASGKLRSLTCTICLDTPTNLTATSCGHTFCHACLMDWLTTAEKADTRRVNCPACRTRLSRTKKLDIVPLEIMVAPKKP